MQVRDRVLEYEVDREIGIGGFGQVFHAVHPVLGQEVAIKVLDPVLARNAEVRERFIQEARIQAQLRHPNIVQVLTADTKSFALVMEYVEGVSLDRVLERRGALPLDDAMRVVEQVLSAVGYAHSRGVVHRDLKPENILVQADGTAKVTDFGIAKVLGSARLTRTGTAMGSAHYMSPEQIRGAKGVDHRTDIYALGCTFFEMVTGRPPFHWAEKSGTDSDFDVKTAHVNAPPPDPRALRPDLPDGVSAAILAALEKDPGRRPPTCEDFASMLGTRGQTATVRVAPVVTSPSAPAVLVPRFRVDETTWAVIPPGGLMMGSPEGEEGRLADEGPQHWVAIRHSFVLKKTPVTQGEWKKLMGNNPSRVSGNPELPVVDVSWFEAIAYCNALSRQEGLPECYEMVGCKGTPGKVGFFSGVFRCDEVRFKGIECPGYRLPTEAEWEYACRAGTTGSTYGPLDDIAWYGDNSDGRMHPVGERRPNAWGLYDMLGNVWEWVQDWYHGSYSGAPSDGSAWENPAGSYRVNRGGGWNIGARDVRAAARDGDGPGNRNGILGFRPARSS